MVNGVYSVSFVGPSKSSGTGVAYLDNGTIRGGDAGYGYFGTYQDNGGKVTASLRIVQHKEGTVSVFGPVKDITLVFNGTAEGSRFNLSSVIPGQADATLNVRGIKVHDL
jgi:hypothetical protein